MEDIRRLLPGSDSRDRHLALALASQFGHVEIVRLLLGPGEVRNGPRGFDSAGRKNAGCWRRRCDRCGQHCGAAYVEFQCCALFRFLVERYPESSLIPDAPEAPGR